MKVPRKFTYFDSIKLLQKLSLVILNGLACVSGN